MIQRHPSDPGTTLNPSPSRDTGDDDRYLPARMINEAAYCPRLFYLMHVEGQFEPNRDTDEGEAVHQRVDHKPDRFRGLFDTIDEPGSAPADQPQTRSAVSNSPQPTAADASSQNADKPIHARSVTLASDRLRVVAKLDLVEAEGNHATPVDYKKGTPKVGVDGMPTAWEPERIQICIQAIVLRENGYQCDEGVLYFHATRQRVRIAIDDELIRLTETTIRKAFEIEDLPAPPPPLVASPKCPRCSLVAICLPDETNRCRSQETQIASPPTVRLPATPRDDLKPLYLNTQGLTIGKKSEVLEIRESGKVVQEVRLREINQVNLFGNIQVTTQALQSLVENQIPLVMHSQRGYFQGMLQGTGLKNILLRREQFRLADDPARALSIARDLVVAKIKNQRVLMMRNHVDPPAVAIKELKRYATMAERAESSGQLLGIEGTAARIYFQHFAGMLKPGDDPLDPLNGDGEPPRFAFDFRGRNRRPPRDPVNALLSLAYALLAKDLTVVAASVGFDPYLGFYHLPRPGRPALAIDLMEPFRPLLADSVVLLAINNRMVYPEHFIEAGRGVTLTDSGRKALIRAYEQRMDQLVTHPLFDYRVSYRRLLEIQTRLMARVVSGELASYPAFVTR